MSVTKSPTATLNINENDSNAIDVEGDGKKDRLTLNIHQIGCGDAFNITAYTSLAQDSFVHYQQDKTVTGSFTTLPQGWRLSGAKVEGAKLILMGHIMAQKGGASPSSEEIVVEIPLSDILPEFEKTEYTSEELAQRQKKMAEVEETMKPLRMAIDDWDAMFCNPMPLIDAPSKTTTIVSGGLGSRGSGLGGGGSADGLGGLGTKGRGTGASGYGSGDGNFGTSMGGLGNFISEEEYQAELIRVAKYLEVRGDNLDPTLVDDVIGRNMPQIRYIYQRELTSDPSLYVSVAVKFTIAADGSVSQAEAVVRESSSDDTDMHSRVTSGVSGRFMVFQFPEPKWGKPVEVWCQFDFRPEI